MRFLTPTDRLASLGWPMTPSCASAMGATPFPSLDPKRAEVMTGNSMHLSCAGIALLLGLTCFGKLDKPPLF